MVSDSVAYDPVALVRATQRQEWQHAYWIANGNPVAIAWIEQEKAKRLEALLAAERRHRRKLLP